MSNSMLSLAVVNDHGTILYTTSFADPDCIKDGDSDGENTYRLLPANMSGHDAIERLYWADGGWKIRAKRPSMFHRWDIDSLEWRMDYEARSKYLRPQVNRARDDLEVMPLAVAGTTLDADDSAIRRMEDVLIAWPYLGMDSIEWMTAENEQVTLNGDELQSLYESVIVRKAERSVWLHRTASELKADIQVDESDIEAWKQSTIEMFSEVTE